MTAKDYKKMTEILVDLSSQYALAANDALKKGSPGEFHRLLTLSEKADDLAEDLTNVYWRKAEEEINEEFEKGKPE